MISAYYISKSSSLGACIFFKNLLKIVTWHDKLKLPKGVISSHHWWTSILRSGMAVLWHRQQLSLTEAPDRHRVIGDCICQVSEMLTVLG